MTRGAGRRNTATGEMDEVHASERLLADAGSTELRKVRLALSSLGSNYRCIAIAPPPRAPHAGGMSKAGGLF